MKKRENRDVLADYIPSLFIVATPFQALCAIEAIETMAIGDYQFVACVFGDIRDKQLFSFLDERKINYIVFNFSGRKYYSLCLYPFIRRQATKYHRAFLGDPENCFQRHVAYMMLSKDSNIAFLDDGTKNIPLLKGYKRNNNKYAFIELLIRKFCCINLSNSFFTLYSDVAIPKFNCRKNKFLHIVKRHQKSEKKGIYFIGTNSTVYCKKLGISLESYFKSLRLQLEFIMAHNNQPIYFIPHGRDINEETKTICEQLKINYIPVNKTVELYIIDAEYSPYAIYAHTSTALYNLKLLYPNTDVYNIFCVDNTNGKYYQDYLMYSDYFEKHGIPKITNMYELLQVD